MRKYLIIILLSIFCLPMLAEEAVFQIEEYSNRDERFVLRTFGRKPFGSESEFVNEFGATSGNRYNQIPRNREASLHLWGWGGCHIDSVCLSLCSNNRAGSCRLLVTAGDSTLFTMPTRDFDSDEWFGAWLSKDLGVYADITKVMTSSYIPTDDDEIAITLKGGTSEGSVYLHRIVVYYTPAPFVRTESAMGYVYEKLDRKAVLADLDTVLFYRSGLAAGDLGGMEASHYLDGVSVSSTSCVYEDGVSHFVLRQQADASWMLVTLWGDTLCAQGAQHLAWNSGTPGWNISIGYDGATVSSTNTAYGTIRYNAPSGSYVRFWNYTSTSLTLPYLYRRLRQVRPVAVSSLSLPAERTVFLEDDTCLLRVSIYPASATDERLFWSSSDTAVAVVRDGVVFLHSLGDATVTCVSYDGQSSASCILHVAEPPTALPAIDAAASAPGEVFDILGRPAGMSAPGIRIIRSGSSVRKQFVR